MTGQEYAFSLTAGLWLNDKSSISLLIHLRKELLVVGWQVIRLREKVVIVRKHGLQSHQVATEHVFLGKIVDSRQMVSSLVGLHMLQKLHCDRAVEPGDVELGVFSLRQVVLKVKLSDFLDHVVVRVLGKHDHALLAPCDFLRVELILIVLVT